MEMRDKRRVLSAAGLLLLGVALAVLGAERGETPVLFQKAVNICFECIGLG